MTHHEIQKQLAKDANTDSVTLYRVFDWLTENQLIHRIAGNDQVGCFSAGGDDKAHEKAHFQRIRCETLACFTEVSLPGEIALPKGYCEEMGFLIEGLRPCSER